MSVKKPFDIAKINPVNHLIVTHWTADLEVTGWDVCDPRSAEPLGHVLPSDATIDQRGMLTKEGIFEETYRDFIAMQNRSVAPEIVTNKEFFVINGALSGVSSHPYIEAADEGSKEAHMASFGVKEDQIETKSYPYAARLANQDDSMVSKWMPFETAKDLVKNTTSMYGYLNHIHEQMETNRYLMTPADSANSIIKGVVKQPNGHEVFDLRDEYSLLIDTSGEPYMSDDEDMKGLMEMMVAEGMISDTKVSNDAVVMNECDWVKLVAEFAKGDVPAVITNKRFEMEMEINGAKFSFSHEGNQFAAQEMLSQLVDLAENLECASIDFKDNAGLKLKFKTSRPSVGVSTGSAMG